ncbi:sugar ABC transporter ATP-binding protein [uncultured Roseobacter sp.]|uniref:sugar ABC transporter ATP-binding protein n=1 Tax=uncultured Roseobacter sp. TaxID=114847 RepID=UPI00260CA6DF|nr:sugar ABC transporter ATP-binding protein [uncultured Roseobacter sp.]
MSRQTQTLLGFDRLRKEYFGVPAVTDLVLDVPVGQVVGVIGENGAGKSTLMNMIGGVVPPTSGQMFWKGQAYAPRSPGDATMLGIAFIHQELNLFTNLTIAENIFVDGFPTRFGLIDRAEMRGKTQALLEQLSLDASPDTMVDHLAPGERQLVEIAKALHRDAELIIFDEPTTSLTPRETARLFETIERLKADHKTILYISHILSDVERLSDRIVVLRDGELVAEGPTDEFDIPRMITAMIGRELSGLFPKRSAKPRGETLLSVQGLSQPGVLDNVSFDIRAGEIFGLFGLMGSGRSEMARILFGLDPYAAGTVTLNGATLAGSVRDRIRAGMAFVTEDRRAEGLMMDASIMDNLSLVSIERFGRTPVALLDEKAIAAKTEALKSDIQIKAGSIAVQPVRSLSGGNQQKVVIGKWLINEPALFILDEPTRGVDVGAKYEIYALADRLAAAGNGILFISSELEEIAGVCDRVMVMNRGEVMGTFDAPPFVDTEILALAFGEQAKTREVSA